MLTPNKQEMRKAIDNHDHIKEYISSLIKDLKYTSRNSSQLLEETINYLKQILTSGVEHPRFKLNSHKLMMYLLLMGDPEVYEQMEDKILPIFKGNCLYNKGAPLRNKGEEFFKKSKFYVQAKNSTQKNEIKRIGSQYIIFSHETVYNLAKWLPFDIENEKSPTKFALVYQKLVKDGVQFSKQFIFYNNHEVQRIEEQIKELQRQLYSSFHSGSSLNSGSLIQLQLNSHKGYKGSLLKHFQNQKSLEQQPSKIRHLQKANEQQKQYYEGEIERLKKFHNNNIKQYESKITYLSEEMEKMREKVAYLQTRTVLQNQNNESKKFSFSITEEKDRIIDDLTKKNTFLQNKVKNLQSQIDTSRVKKQSSLGDENQLVQKLKKQNKVLKTKLLTEFEETTEFRSTEKGFSSSKNKGFNSLQFIGYQDAKSSYEPFYSNSSAQNKTRLRKAILRDKELIYKDKNIQMGCITKLQSRDSIRMVVVCTNVSQKPIFQLFTEFVSRQDISIRLITEARNYLQIGGQTKSQLLVTIKNIDFRCLLCSLKFTLQEKEEKVAIILPISKLKLMRQLVFTPINEKKELCKIEKVINPDKKIIPSIQKFKEYFKNALLQVDRTNHETYHLKLQFLGHKFYLQCDEVGGELRVAVKYEIKYLAEAEKLLDELTFIFSK